MKNSPILLGIVCLSVQCFAQEFRIESLSGNGTLAWHDDQYTNSRYTIQWTSSVTNQWRDTWTPLRNIALSNGTVVVEVPILYRVMRTKRGLAPPSLAGKAYRFYDPYGTNLVPYSFSGDTNGTAFFSETWNQSENYGQGFRKGRFQYQVSGSDPNIARLSVDFDTIYLQGAGIDVGGPILQVMNGLGAAVTFRAEAVLVFTNGSSGLSTNTYYRSNGQTNTVVGTFKELE